MYEHSWKHKVNGKNIETSGKHRAKIRAFQTIWNRCAKNNFDKAFKWPSKTDLWKIINIYLIKLNFYFGRAELYSPLKNLFPLVIQDFCTLCNFTVFALNKNLSNVFKLEASPPQNFGGQHHKKGQDFFRVKRFKN